MRKLVILYVITLVVLILMMLMNVSLALKIITWIINLVLFVTVFKEDLKFFF